MFIKNRCSSTLTCTHVVDAHTLAPTVYGSRGGFVQGNALHDPTRPWTRELMVPSCRGASPVPSCRFLLSPSCPPTPTTHPQLLFFFRNFPVPTHSSSCSVQGENKTKIKKPKHQTYCLFCFSEVIGFESGIAFTYSEIIASRSRQPMQEEGGVAALTAPGQTCPAGQRSGPPSHSPPAAAPWGRNPGAAWRSVAAGGWRQGGVPWQC